MLSMLAFAFVSLMFFPSFAPAFAQDVTKDFMPLYNRSCRACHLSGAANAPRTGDSQAWQSRLAGGMELMLARVKQGYKSMPPMGLCPTCSDEDLRNMILFMADKL